MKERIIVIVAVLVSVLLLVFTDFGRGQGRIYDCRDAHWHPDVPIEVKRECGRLMYEEWKRLHDEKQNDPSIYENRSNLLRT